MRLRIALASLFLPYLTLVASDFQNLNFDQADVTGVQTAGGGPASALLPGWSVTSGGVSLDVIFNAIPPDPGMGHGEAHLMSTTNWNNYPVYGKLGLVLIPAVGIIPPNAITNVPVRLAQQGQIPGTAKSIRFLASSSFFSDPPNFFDIRINGTPLTLLYQPLADQTRSGFAVWSVSADVSPFAGQGVELAIETKPQAFPTPGYPSPVFYNGIDEIEFSPLAFVLPPSLHLRLTKAHAGDLTLSWSGAAWLESGITLSGPWIALPATSPYTATLFPGSFFRLKYFAPVDPGP